MKRENDREIDNRSREKKKSVSPLVICCWPLVFLSQCGVCPVFEHCTPGGVISPEACPYIDQWLADDEAAGGGAMAPDIEELY